MTWWSALDALVRRVVIAAVVILMIVALGLAYCGQRERNARLSDDLKKSDTRTGSAVVAIEEIDKLGQRGEVAATELEKAQDAIRQADPVDRDAIARAELLCLQHGSACNGV